jgi:hypothetical protein
MARNPPNRDYAKASRAQERPIKNNSRNLQASKAMGSPYQMNPQLLSADRILHQNSFRI